MQGLSFFFFSLEREYNKAPWNWVRLSFRREITLESESGSFQTGRGTEATGV